MTRDDQRARSSSQAQSVDLAINRVLAAEVAAREAIAACEREAEQEIAAAELESRAIAQSAERRMQRAQRIADQGIERALEQLRSPLSETARSSPSHDDPRVLKLAAVLAEEVTDFGLRSAPRADGYGTSSATSGKGSKVRG